MRVAPFGLAFGIDGKPGLPYVENVMLRFSVFLNDYRGLFP